MRATGLDVLEANVACDGAFAERDAEARGGPAN